MCVCLSNCSTTAKKYEMFKPKIKNHDDNIFSNKLIYYLKPLVLHYTHIFYSSNLFSFLFFFYTLLIVSIATQRALAKSTMNKKKKKWRRRIRQEENETISHSIYQYDGNAFAFLTYYKFMLHKPFVRLFSFSIHFFLFTYYIAAFLPCTVHCTITL